MYRDLGILREKRGIEPLLTQLLKEVQGPLRVMEVCGTHTVSIFRHGLRSILPKELTLISGPGCPVCVTSQGDIDQMVDLSLRDGVRVVTFGDMLKVPGSQGSLKDAMAQGAKIDVVYSPLDALEIAKRHKGEEVVFLGIGFETTAPAISAMIKRAKGEGIENLSVYPAMKLIPPALSALMSSSEVDIQGLLCPGHVSAIIGARAYETISTSYRLPCVVSGFEPGDILLALLAIARQMRRGEAKVENMYPRAVTYEGNSRAVEIMDEVFEREDSHWRGLGTIPSSGLRPKGEYEYFSARLRFSLKPKEVPEPKGCRCGEVLKGAISPPECPLFGRGCTPSSPIGPCMVSSEGTCQAYYRYALRG